MLDTRDGELVANMVSSLSAFRKANLESPEVQEHYTAQSISNVQKAYAASVRFPPSSGVVDESTFMQNWNVASFGLTKSLAASNVYSPTDPIHSVSRFIWGQQGVSEPLDADILSMSRRIKQAADAKIDAKFSNRTLLVFPITFKVGVTLSLDIRCALCHRSLIGTQFGQTQLEHMDVWSQFKGTPTVNSFSNIYPAHATCNHDRGDGDFITWALSDKANQAVDYEGLQLANTEAGFSSALLPSLAYYSNVDKRRVQIAYYNLFRRFNEAEAMLLAPKYLDQPDNAGMKAGGRGVWTPINLMSTALDEVSNLTAPEFAQQAEAAVIKGSSGFSSKAQSIDLSQLNSNTLNKWATTPEEVFKKAIANLDVISSTETMAYDKNKKLVAKQITPVKHVR